MSLIVDDEDHLLRALVDIGVSSNIILEAFTSTIFQFIKTDDSNTTTWSILGGKFTTIKTGPVTSSLPEFNIKNQISWQFHVDYRSESLSTDVMIIDQGRDLL
jgi:hypothetical protein